MRAVLTVGRRAGMRRRALAAMVAAAALQAGPAWAAESRVFPFVTPIAFECVKAISAREHGTIYEQLDPDRGTATTATALWTVVLDYIRDPVNGDLRYTLVRKTWFVPMGAIWGGIEDTLRRCPDG